jgi:hypothetical protein
MKTPMQELIETLKELQETQDPYTLQDAIEIAESMLEKEKEQTIDFSKTCLNKAKDLDVLTAFLNVDSYYNETFNTKEK